MCIFVLIAAIALNSHFIPSVHKHNKLRSKLLSVLVWSIHIISVVNDARQSKRYMARLHYVLQCHLCCRIWVAWVSCPLLSDDAVGHITSVSWPIAPSIAVGSQDPAMFFSQYDFC
ncbi:dTDP-glucose 4,6-dehydratase [Trypanosoma cruzi]|nr:dTDP-glucose 4,6-dehydratase [Trypanosoma cruzi]